MNATPSGALRRAFSTALLALAVTTPALAEDKSPPIKLLVGFPAGGSTDVIARNLALGMERELGQPVVVENRAGAGGQIAAQVVKSAKPDGTTLFLTNSHAITMIPNTLRSPGYNVAKDFAPISLVATNPDVLAVSVEATGTAPAGLHEFIGWAKRNPGKGNVGVPAPASMPDFVVNVIGRSSGSDLKAVPYRGDGPVAQDLVAGQIAGGIGSVGVMLPYVATGKIKIIAVNGTHRLSNIPEVPTYAELGLKGIDDQIFTAVIAPAGTAPDVVRRYNAAIVKVVGSAEMREKLSNLGITLMGSTPEALAQRIEASTKAAADIVRQVGFTMQ